MRENLAALAGGQRLLTVTAADATAPDRPRRERLRRDRRPAGPARHRPDRPRRRVRGADGRQRLGQVHARPRPDRRCVPLAARRGARCSAPRSTDFDDWQRIGFVPQRAGAAGGVPASVWEVVASGRLTRRRLLRPLSRRRPGRDRRRARGRRARRPGAGRRLHALGRPAAAGADRPRARRRAASCSFLDEPTAGVDLPNQQALADALGMLSEQRRHHRAGRPRARADGAADRPVGRDARRPGGLRRRRRWPTTTSHHADFGDARATTTTTTTRAGTGTTTRPHVGSPSTCPSGGTRGGD